MNKVVQKAHEIAVNHGTDCYYPDLEIGEICEINDLWDGKGEEPSTQGSYAHFICEDSSGELWINYLFEVVEKKENELDTLIKITGIDLI